MLTIFVLNELPNTRCAFRVDITKGIEVMRHQISEELNIENDFRLTHCGDNLTDCIFYSLTNDSELDLNISRKSLATSILLSQHVNISSEQLVLSLLKNDLQTANHLFDAEVSISDAMTFFVSKVSCRNPMKKPEYDSLAYLLQRGASPNVINKLTRMPLLCTAASTNDLSVVQLLLSHPDVDKDCRSFAGQTPLICASIKNNSRIISMLTDGRGVS